MAGQAAVLVDPLDPQAIAAAIEQVLADASLRDRLIGQGYGQIQKFSWAAAARETLAVLERVGARR